MEKECRFIPVQCPWCSKKVHNKEVESQTLLLIGILHEAYSLNYCYYGLSQFLQHHIKQECGHVVVACPNGCGEKLPRKDVRLQSFTLY